MRPRGYALGRLDATVPLEERDRFRSGEFVDPALDPAKLSTDPAVVRKYL